MLALNLTNQFILIIANIKLLPTKFFIIIHVLKNEELVDWSKLKNKKLKIRIWDSGDIFQPLGMKNKKKISDFLVNEKINNIAKKARVF